MCGISYFHENCKSKETQHDTSCPWSLVGIAKKWNSHFISQPRIFTDFSNQVPEAPEADFAVGRVNGN